MISPRTSADRRSAAPWWLCVSLMGTVAAAGVPDQFRDGQAPATILAIGRMPQPPVLDGRLSDWPADASVILLGQAADRLRRAGNWGGTPDLSGAVRLAWDPTNLYVAAEICDDRLEQAAGPAEIWQGDTLELFFNVHPWQQRVDGFWQIALVPPLKAEATLRATGPQKEFEGVAGTAQVRTNGYALECRIPWQNLTGFTPAVGACLGFQIYLDDRDGSGRKTQLAWYPSAITFAHPTHTGMLILRPSGDTAAPRVLAGPATWCVTDARTMRVTVIADVAGARTATISPVPPFPDSALPPPTDVTLPLQPAGERVSLGQGVVNVEGLEGLFHFSVTVAGAEGRVVAANVFQTQLVGAPYARMQALYDAANKRVAALQQREGVDPLARAGLAAWLTRNGAFIGNEARPECLSRALLDQMLTELAAIDSALTRLEGGRDPYAEQRGSLVRAYRSPLTGQPRPYALFIPQQYDPAGTNAAPLIVLLHTIFADERQLAMMTDTFRDLGAIVYQGAAYRQFDWGGISAAETWAGLEDVLRRYRIDADRVYLIGCHNGGRGVWQLSMGRPDLWAAAAPLFSGIDSRPPYPAMRLYPEWYEQAVAVAIPPPQFTAPPRPAPVAGPLERGLFTLASLVPRLENIAALPLRSAFGEDDPDAAAERLAMQQRLQELGAPLATRYVPGAMHGSIPDEWADPAFYRGLLAQRRPPPPGHVTFVAPGLRYNRGWWVQVDELTSPAAAARVDARITGDAVTVQTTNTTALSLLLDARVVAAGTRPAIRVDGSAIDPAAVAAIPAPIRLLRAAAGRWSVGQPPAGSKRHGLSGPINDFQFDRFLFVYGTGGDEKEQAALANLGKRMADWGLGATFETKADRAVTDADLRDAHLILIGTPGNHTLLAQMADRLPLRWTDNGLALGKLSVQGPGAGACFICPNPLSPERYVVVVTGTDEAGYQVWTQREPDGDYVMGRVASPGAAAGFQVTARGWFDNRWQWTQDLCLPRE